MKGSQMTVAELRKLGELERFLYYVFHNRKGCINCHWLVNCDCTHKGHIELMTKRYGYPIKLTFDNYEEWQEISAVGSKCLEWELVQVGKNRK